MVISFIGFYYLISRIGYWQTKYHNDMKYLRDYEQINEQLDIYIERDFSRIKNNKKKK